METFIDDTVGEDGSAQTQIAPTSHVPILQSSPGRLAPVGEREEAGGIPADSRSIALQEFRKSVLARKREDKLVMLARGL